MSRQSGTGQASKSPKRRQELLDAAAQVFFERSYADATVQNIADALGILKGSLYYYIDTKEDLLFWLLEEIHDAVDEVLAEAARHDDLPALDRLTAYVREQVEWSLRNFVKITVYYHDMGGLGETRRNQILERRKPHEDYVTELIRGAQAEGTADGSLDPRLLANCVFGTMIWTYRWYRPGASASPAEIADGCALYALRGVAGDLALPPAT